MASNLSSTSYVQQVSQPMFNPTQFFWNGRQISVILPQMTSLFTDSHMSTKVEHYGELFFPIFDSIMPNTSISMTKDSVNLVLPCLVQPDSQNKSFSHRPYETVSLEFSLLGNDTSQEEFLDKFKKMDIEYFATENSIIISLDQEKFPYYRFIEKVEVLDGVVMKLSANLGLNSDSEAIIVNLFKYIVFEKKVYTETT